MSASVHRMFNARQWALLPDDAIVQQYSECLVAGIFASREKFPVIEVAIHVDSAAVAVAPELYQDREDFSYRLIPVMGMERIPITRQNERPGVMSANNFTVHFYPFDTLPVLVSHIHPKFVIKATAEAVTSQTEDISQPLIQQFPILDMIVKLSLAWNNSTPDRAKEDRSYMSPHDPSSTDDSDDEGNGSDDEDNNEYQNKVTERGRFDLKR